MNWIRNYIGITVGAMITAVSLNMFLIPNKIAAGGTSGLATVFHYLFGVPVGMTMLSMDIPLLLLSVKILGARFGINTLFGAAVLSITIDLSAAHIPVLTHDLLLGALYGGVLSGVGLGIVFRFRGTTAGTDLAAAILHKLFGVSVGQALLGVDFFVIAFAGIAFKSPEVSLYALISLFVTTKIIDVVQEGASSSKAFIVMTDAPDKIAQEIMAELERGVTIFQAKGGYTNMTRDVLFCVVKVGEVSRVKDVVYRHDRRAFVIVSDAHEVLGEGFSDYR